jgi:hypothetical protein
MLVEVQVIRQNTGNWKYDIKADKELINPAYIVRIKPCPNKEENVFFVHLFGTEERYPLVIDKTSYDNLQIICV